MGEFGAPTIIDAGAAAVGASEPVHPLSKSKAAKATASTVTELLNMGLTVGMGLPLSDDERRDFQRDLAAVLRKHDVPDLPWAEEVALATTTVRIVVPRIAAMDDLPPGEPSPPPPPPEPIRHDSVGPRKEGVRKNRFDSQAGLPETHVGSEAASVLS
jgi:hypothetical protein